MNRALAWVDPSFWVFRARARRVALLPTHRTPADLTTCLAAFAVHQLLVATGLFTVGFWDRLLWIPLLAAD